MVVEKCKNLPGFDQNDERTYHNPKYFDKIVTKDPITAKNKYEYVPKKVGKNYLYWELRDNL